MEDIRILFLHEGVILLLDILHAGLFLQRLQVTRIPFSEEVELLLGHALQVLGFERRHCRVQVVLGIGGKVRVSEEEERSSFSEMKLPQGAAVNEENSTYLII